jgi:hypothetical protein
LPTRAVCRPIWFALQNSPCLENGRATSSSSGRHRL